MNKPVPQVDIERQAREAAAEEFSIAAHYAGLIVGHLQVGDDAGAIWSMEQFKQAGRRAFAAFSPIREAIRQRGREALEGGRE